MNLTAHRPEEIVAKRGGVSAKGFQLQCTPVRSTLSRTSYLYRGGNMVICVYRSNPMAIESLVPEPLRPASCALVHAWQTDFQAFKYLVLVPITRLSLASPLSSKGSPD